jgi:ssDNA thymidine ADP-ribosyltransferase, DarT
VPSVPDPTPIFHITPIDNLASIARCGALLSKAAATAQGLVAANIAYPHIQGRRAVKAIPIAPGGSLHDYVPFFFAPRPPMLLAINKGNVPGCDYRQDDIVHVVSQAQAIRDGGHRFVFSDVHAALDIARFFDDLAHLGEIDWGIFFEQPLLGGYCKYWNNRPDTPRHVRRQETRQAEFLVHQRVPIAAVSLIGVRTAEGEARIRAALAGTGWDPALRVVPGWYY